MLDSDQPTLKHTQIDEETKKRKEENRQVALMKRQAKMKALKAKINLKVDAQFKSSIESLFNGNKGFND